MAHARRRKNERRFSAYCGNNFAQAQTNGSQQISSAKTYCELAVQYPFFETSQSCVSTMATLSHRFKSSPAISGKVAVPGAAGYMMMAGHFSKNNVSSGDLNRSPESRGSQTSGVLLVLFVQAKRINSFSLQRTSRFCKPRISAHRQQLRTNKIKSFCRLAAALPAFLTQKAEQKRLSLSGKPRGSANLDSPRRQRRLRKKNAISS